MDFLPYAVNIIINTFLIYAAIGIIDRGNYRNTLFSAFIAAVVLGFAAGLSFLFFFLGLLIWVYILINWYSIGFFKSFISLIIYTALNLVITFLIGVLFIGPQAYRQNAVLKEIVPVIREKYGERFEDKKSEISEYIEKKTALYEKGKAQKKKKEESPREESGKAKIVFKTGSVMEADILKEEDDRYIVDIASGASEAVIRKDLVERIEMPGEAADLFAYERQRMVDSQIKSRGVRDEKVLKAMLNVKRHLFVPKELEANAYDDNPLPIGLSQTISQPYIVAYMTELANLSPRDKVLEIGTGSGYQAAVLAEIVSEVHTIEIIKELADSARQKLKELGYKNVTVKCADGYKGWPEEAPFDAIIVTAAPPEVPEELKNELKVGGKMVVPVGSFYQELYVIERTREGFKEKNVIPVSFVPMVREKK